MKYLVIIGVLIFSSVHLTAQNRISIQFKNGKVVNGIGRIKADDNILYRQDKDAAKEIYDFKTVRKLTIYGDAEERHFEYKLVGASDIADFKLLEIDIVGKVTLYKEDLSTTHYNPDMFGGSGFASVSGTNYYISKTGSNRARTLGNANTYSKRFRKIAEDFFSDCPDLIEKIKSKSYFKRYFIRTIIDYYNNECQ